MSDNLQLEIKKVFDAPIAKVWDAWTNPESLKQWKSPAGMTTPEAEVDLRVGGNYKIVMEGHDQANPNYNGRAVVGGKYIEVEKPHKLVYTWLWEGAPADTHTTTITVKLHEVADNKTEVTLIHTGFADENMVSEHNLGWDSTLKKLEDFLQ